MTNAVITAQQSSQGGDLGFKNRLINGGFDVWQRGTSFSPATNSTYTADRWWCVTDAVGTVNVTQVDVSAQGLNTQYALRAERSAGTNRWVVGTNLETNVTKALLGKTVTFSCKVRKGSGLNANVDVSVGTQSQEAKFGSLVDNGSFTITNASMNTSSFTQFTTTFFIPASSTATGFKVEFSATQAGGTGVYFEIAEVQVEVGSAATGFDYRFYGTELALCQRYYYQRAYEGEGSAVCSNLGFAWTNSTYKWINVFFPVTMRATPTVVPASGAGAGFDGKLRYLTGTGSAAGNDVVPYSISAFPDRALFKSYNEAGAFTHYGVVGGYKAEAEL